MTDQDINLFQLFFGTKQQDATTEQLLHTKSDIGALMAEIVVAKVAVGLIGKQAEQIKTGVEGEQALGNRLAALAMDCESKIARICEGWDANPTNTQFTHSRGAVVEGLERVHEAASDIAELTGSLLRVFKLPQEPTQE